MTVAARLFAHTAAAATVGGLSVGHLRHRSVMAVRCQPQGKHRWQHPRPHLHLHPHGRRSAGRASFAAVAASSNASYDGDGGGAANPDIAATDTVATSTQKKQQPQQPQPQQQPQQPQQPLQPQQPQRVEYERYQRQRDDYAGAGALIPSDPSLAPGHIVLVDGMSLIFRAFYGWRNRADPLLNSAGQDVSVLYSAGTE